MTDADNPHLTPAPVTLGPPAPQAGVVVYAVHGRGQSVSFMEDLAQRVALPDVAWVLPAAAGGTWYPEPFLRPMSQNEPRLGQAREAVRQHLAQVREGAGVVPVVVLGFSQGACLLAEHLLDEQPPVAGAVLHTGGYLGPDEHAWPDREGVLRDVPVLMSTAQADAWVPMHRVEATARALAGLGARVTLDVYDDEEHHVNDNAVERIRGFLRRLSGGT
ncbi:alpha/beta hydrolase [Ornithinimicrobium cerasi]|uniref:alpha/beta hydrolase n=1 Tax=Ornithinimicrobium cerasi TaxID=2248773 RepID=UPI000EFF166E|nr:dienelactone hydrolase family protein [Ornithinimicrobium cerasi]